jgi:hypothetical protein
MSLSSILKIKTMNFSERGNPRGIGGGGPRATQHPGINDWSAMRSTCGGFGVELRDVLFNCIGHGAWFAHDHWHVKFKRCLSKAKIQAEEQQPSGCSTNRRDTESWISFQSTAITNRKSLTSCVLWLSPSSDIPRFEPFWPTSQAHAREFCQKATKPPEHRKGQPGKGEETQNKQGGAKHDRSTEGALSQSRKRCP